MVTLAMAMVNMKSNEARFSRLPLRGPVKRVGSRRLFRETVIIAITTTAIIINITRTRPAFS